MEDIINRISVSVFRFLKPCLQMYREIMTTTYEKQNPEEAEFTHSDYLLLKAATTIVTALDAFFIAKNAHPNS